MNVLVVGANGQIGQKIVRLLGQSDRHEVVAMIRKAEQADALEKLGAKTKLADLEQDVRGTAEGHDAVIFTAGSGGHTGPDKTMLVDLDGAFKMIDESVRANVRHFIMISAFHADDPLQGSEKIKHYNVAKHRADERLMNSGLTYTILRPGRLTDEPGTGKIQVGAQLSDEDHQRHIPREDVAQTAVAALDIENAKGKVFKMLTGETPIEEALKNL